MCVRKVFKQGYNPYRIMPRLTGMEWLKKHIAKLEVSKLQDSIDKIKKIKAKIYDEFQPWTPLKLILLNYSLDTCTTIIRKKVFFKYKYYVDLFAGSGLNKIKNSDDFFIGSPLVASLNYSKDYNSMFFYEKNIEFFNALKKRLESLKKNNLKVVPGDCNSFLDNIMEKINKSNTYAFFFVDPYCMEFSWDSMKRLLNIREDTIIGRDILFNFMSSGIIRFIGLAKKGKSNGIELTEFFGNDSWKQVNSIEDSVELYKRNILEERPRTIIKTIKIKSKKHGFCYHLFFITNKTKGQNPWLKSIDKVKKEIESNSDKSVEMSLDIIKKRQSELHTYFQ